MKGKKKRLLAGTLALLLSCSTLLNTGITALASEQSEEHAQIQEVKQEEAASETLPELEEVKEQLTEEELVYAEDLTIKAGESFDLETDYRGFQKNDEKVKVTFLKAEGDSGNSFDFNTPGSYQAFYHVDPLSGNPSYQIMRRIVVEARENSTQEPQGEVSQHTEDGSGEDGEADPDPEIPEVLTEEPEMPDAGAELIDLTPKEDKGMFLSVVPAAMEQQKGSNVHLVQGEKIPYPSNVGNYSTSYFTVNGHVAYCLESMKASPPTSDYVANEFESNPELQKVLYYAYARSMPNTTSNEVSYRYGFNGTCCTMATGCTTGIDSIGFAYDQIRCGELDVMICGAAEAPITPITIAAFEAIGTLSTNNNPPEKASRPFDDTRNGFVLAEAAGILVLEELGHALNRGAHIYGEIAGYGSVNNAMHMTGLKPDGEDLSRAIKIAIEEANVTPFEIDYINAHGSGTKQNDINETGAYKKVFGELAYKIPMSSTKSMTGHPLGAASAVEAIVCCLALENNFMPPTINYNKKDALCDLDYIPNCGREKNLNVVLTNASGFGGLHAAMILKKYID